jgi:hypothetical protein
MLCLNCVVGLDQSLSCCKALFTDPSNNKNRIYMKQLTALVLAAALALPAAAAPGVKPDNTPASRRVAPRPAPQPGGWAMLAVAGLLVGLGMFRRPARAEVFS